MSKAQKKPIPPQKKVAPAATKRLSILEWLDTPNQLIFVLLLVVATIAVYYPTFQNELTAWDDSSYIRDNPDVTHDTPGFLQRAFTVKTGNVMGNYHPLTMVSLKLNYMMGGLDPFGYQFINILLHILNTCLVFFLILKLCGRNGIAFLSALIFAIHPMHVESVSWIAERKDLLYSFFWLLGAITYVEYAKGKKQLLFYSATLLLFVLSCLSKGMGVSLTFALFLFDYFLNRPMFSKQAILDKLPFIALSVVFGLIAIDAQKAFSAVNAGAGLYARILFASYGYVQYVVRLLIPMKQVILYYAPDGGTFDHYIIYTILIIVTTIVLALYFRKNKELIFGMAFYFVILLPVSQIIFVGQAIIADRYTYLPYIGLLFVLGILIYKLIDRKQSGYMFKQFVSIIVIAWITMMGIRAHNRVPVWKDTISICTDALNYKLFGVGSEVRGTAYFQKKMYKEALHDFDVSVTDGLRDDINFYMRGKTYCMLSTQEQVAGNRQKQVEYARFAINDLNFAEKIWKKNIDPDLYYTRAGMYFNFGIIDSAYYDMVKMQQTGSAVDTSFLGLLTNIMKSQGLLK